MFVFDNYLKYCKQLKTSISTQLVSVTGYAKAYGLTGYINVLGQSTDLIETYSSFTLQNKMPDLIVSII